MCERWRHQSGNTDYQFQRHEVQFVHPGAALIVGWLAVRFGAAVHQGGTFFAQAITSKQWAGAVPQQALQGGAVVCLNTHTGVHREAGLGPVEPSAGVYVAALACVVASACYGFSTPLMKRALSRMQPLQIAAGLHAMSFLMLIPGAAWSWPSAQFTPIALLAVVIMGVVTSGIAYWMHIRILAHVSSVAAMSPTFMIPVFGVMWGHVFLGEALSTGIFAGGALVLLASALITGFSPWQKWLDVADTKL